MILLIALAFFNRLLSTWAPRFKVAAERYEILNKLLLSL